MLLLKMLPNDAPMDVWFGYVLSFCGVVLYVLYVLVWFLRRVAQLRDRDRALSPGNRDWHRARGGPTRA